MYSIEVQYENLNNWFFLKGNRIRNFITWAYTSNIATLPLEIITSKSKCNVYTICRQTQLSTRLYANLLNVNLNYMFRPNFVAETCKLRFTFSKLAYHLVLSCVWRRIVYTLHFDLFDTQRGWRTSKKIIESMWRNSGSIYIINVLIGGVLPNTL